MRIITSANGLLRTLSPSPGGPPDDARIVVTGLPALDALLPGGRFVSGAVHEVLSSTEVPCFLLPVLIARSAARFGRVVWCDQFRRLYPPAVAALGLPLDHLVVLRPQNTEDEIWAAAECLRCRGVSAFVAPLHRLSRIQARRLQLAAERGGGLGVVLRPAGAASRPYAAVTRWLVKPAAGERTVQRWSFELLHGHGGRVGQSVLLEVCRETHTVRSVEALVDRAARTKAVPASA